MRKVKNIPARVKCAECCSSLDAALGDADEDVRKVNTKHGARLYEREKDLVSKAEDTAKLVDRYGRLSVYALAGRRIMPEVAGDILRKYKRPTSGFFEAVMEAEREALKERFW